MLSSIFRHKRYVALTLLILGVGLLLTIRILGHRVPASGKAARGAMALFVPVEAGVQGVLRLPEKWIRDFSELRRLRQENERLRKEILEMQLQASKTQLIESDNARMREVLKIKPPEQRVVRMVRVVAQDASTWNSTLLVGAGREDGLASDSPLVTPQGVVGRVVDVFPTRSRVMLLQSPSSHVAAVDVRSQVRGVVVGTGGPRLRMEFVAAGADVEAGDKIVSSGMGGVFPRGYPVGTVVKKTVSTNGLMLELELVPAVDFGTVEYLYVLAPVEDML